MQRIHYAPKYKIVYKTRKNIWRTAKPLTNFHHQKWFFIKRTHTKRYLRLTKRIRLRRRIIPYLKRPKKHTYNLFFSLFPLQMLSEEHKKLSYLHTVRFDIQSYFEANLLPAGIFYNKSGRKNLKNLPNHLYKKRIYKRVLDAARFRMKTSPKLRLSSFRRHLFYKKRRYDRRFTKKQVWRRGNSLLSIPRKFTLTTNAKFEKLFRAFASRGRLIQEQKKFIRKNKSKLYLPEVKSQIPYVPYLNRFQLETIKRRLKLLHPKKNVMGVWGGWKPPIIDNLRGDRRRRKRIIQSSPDVLIPTNLNTGHLYGNSRRHRFLNLSKMSKKKKKKVSYLDASKKSLFNRKSKKKRQVLSRIDFTERLNYKYFLNTTHSYGLTNPKFFFKLKPKFLKRIQIFNLKSEQPFYRKNNIKHSLENLIKLRNQKISGQKYLDLKNNLLSIRKKLKITGPKEKEMSNFKNQSRAMFKRKRDRERTYASLKASLKQLSSKRKKTKRSRLEKGRKDLKYEGFGPPAFLKPFFEDTAFRTKEHRKEELNYFYGKRPSKLFFRNFLTKDKALKKVLTSMTKSNFFRGRFIRIRKKKRLRRIKRSRRVDSHFRKSLFKQNILDLRKERSRLGHLNKRQFLNFVKKTYFKTKYNRTYHFYSNYDRRLDFFFMNSLFFSQSIFKSQEALSRRFVTVNNVILKASSFLLNIWDKIEISKKFWTIRYLESLKLILLSPIFIKKICLQGNKMIDFSLMTALFIRFGNAKYNKFFNSSHIGMIKDIRLLKNPKKI